MTKMPEHIRGTYLLLCGKGAKEVKSVLRKTYSALDCEYEPQPPIPSSMMLHKYLNFNKLFDRIVLANMVQFMILDLYNVYCPIKDKPIENDIDFHDEDFTWIKNEK